MDAIRWTVLSRNGERCFCRCECGTERWILERNLRKGKSKSCGCLKREVTGARNRRHGLSKSPLYYVWLNMRNRCTDPANNRWHRYGARGISVCDRWMYSFEYFLADMGEPQAGMTIERIDNNGNYCPENCRWATRQEQAFNNSRNHRLAHEGLMLTITEWSQRLQIDRMTITMRLKSGCTAAEALAPLNRITGKPLGQARNEVDALEKLLAV